MAVRDLSLEEIENSSEHSRQADKFILVVEALISDELDIDKAGEVVRSVREDEQCSDEALEGLLKAVAVIRKARGDLLALKADLAGGGE